MFFVYFPVWNYIFLNFWILQFTISNLFAKVLAHWFFFFDHSVPTSNVQNLFVSLFVFFSFMVSILFLFGYCWLCIKHYILKVIDRNNLKLIN